MSAEEAYCSFEQRVSNQLISPTSGDNSTIFFSLSRPSSVSNQLISPTSGDSIKTEGIKKIKTGFQSINIPNEWG